MANTGERVIRRRRAPRRVLAVRLPAKIVSVDGTRAFRCEVCDISQSGAKLATVDAATVPDTFFLALSSQGGAHRSCSVVWRTAKEIGVQFVRDGAPL